MTEDLSKIIVKVKETDPVICGTAPFTSEYFIDEYQGVLVYRTPEYYLGTGDIQKFKQGRYRHFSDTAKAMIKAYSGLNWERKARAGDPLGAPRVQSDARLLALYNSDVLRNWLEEYFDVTLDPDSELMSPPSESEFTAGLLPESTL